MQPVYLKQASLLPPRALTHTVNGLGASVRPKRAFSEGGGFPFGGLNLKACSRLDTVRNTSILASCSPMHTLRPDREAGETLALCACKLIHLYANASVMCLTRACERRQAYRSQMVCRILSSAIFLHRLRSVQV